LASNVGASIYYTPIRHLWTMYVQRNNWQKNDKIFFSRVFKKDKVFNVAVLLWMSYCSESMSSHSYVTSASQHN
jgi:hypothetical protein